MAFLFGQHATEQLTPPGRRVQQPGAQGPLPPDSPHPKCLATVNMHSSKTHGLTGTWWHLSLPLRSAHPREPRQSVLAPLVGRGAQLALSKAGARWVWVGGASANSRAAQKSVPQVRRLSETQTPCTSRVNLLLDNVT